MTARSSGGLAGFSAEEGEGRRSVACSSGNSFSLKGSAFEGDDGPRIFSVICSSGSASLEKRKEERRRLLALLCREVMRKQVGLRISSSERVDPTLLGIEGRGR